MATKKTTAERADAKAASARHQIASVAVVKDVAAVNELIISMCEDPRIAKAFQENPRDTLEQAGVSKEMADMVIAGREYVLTTIVTGPGGFIEAAVVVVVVIVVVVIV